MAAFMKGWLTGRDWGVEKRLYDRSLGYKAHMHVPNADDPKQRAVVTAAILNAVHEREAVVVHGGIADRALYDLVVSAAESAGRGSDIFEIWSDKERPGHAGRPYRSCLRFGTEIQYERLSHAFGRCPSVGRSWVPKVLLHCMENFLNLMAERGEPAIEVEDIPEMLGIGFLGRISGGDFGQMPDHMKFVGDYVNRVTEGLVWNDGTVFGMAEHEELVSDIRNVLERLGTLRCTQRGMSIADVFRRKLICFVWSSSDGMVDEFVACDLKHAIQRLYVGSLGSEAQQIQSRSLLVVKDSEWFLSQSPPFEPSLAAICRSVRVDAILPTRAWSLPGLAVGPNHALGPDIVRHVALGLYSVRGSRVNVRGHSRLFSSKYKGTADFRHLLRLKQSPVR